MRIVAFTMAPPVRPEIQAPAVRLPAASRERGSFGCQTSRRFMAVPQPESFPLVRRTGASHSPCRGRGRLRRGPRTSCPEGSEAGARAEPTDRTWTEKCCNRRPLVGGSPRARPKDRVVFSTVIVDRVHAKARDAGTALSFGAGYVSSARYPGSISYSVLSPHVWAEGHSAVRYRCRP